MADLSEITLPVTFVHAKDATVAVSRLAVGFFLQTMCVCARASARTCVCMCVHACVCVRMCICVYACVCVCMCVCVCVCVSVCARRRREINRKRQRERGGGGEKKEKSKERKNRERVAHLAPTSIVQVQQWQVQILNTTHRVGSVQNQKKQQQGLQYVVTDFLISTCEKSYASSKPTGLGKTAFLEGFSSISRLLDRN